MVSIVSARKIVKEGEHAEFNCTATGVGVNDFSYQWFLNNINIKISSLESTLVIDSVSEDNTGNYTCSVKNPYGEIGESGIARLILGTYINGQHT